jgi:G3E family GTPase
MTRIACIGGFLGSGKTTAIIQAARTLMGRGVRVGIITNDQGHHLVDTALVRGLGFDAEEIGGGCFCCRFPEFAARARQLVEQFQAQVILAEAVGSCTDLSLTVCRRLRQYHSAQFVVAPLTVMVDPNRVREMRRARPPFDDNVRYLFGKQLAEADRVVLTKADLFDAEEIDNLRSEIPQFAGDIPVSVMSAKTGLGVSEWVDLIRSSEAGGRELQMDYDVYGQAEASLGWLNANIDLTSGQQFRSIDLGEALMARIQQACQTSGSAVAHLKIMFVTAEGNDWIALTEGEGRAAWGGNHELPCCPEASMIINARVCAAPDHLQKLIEESVKQVTSERGISAAFCDLESFSPLPPTRPVGGATI